MRVGVAVVAAGEVAVEGGHDRVGTFRIIHMPAPLTDTGAACIGEYDAADLRKVVEQAVAIGGIADLFRPGRDGKFGLDFQVFLLRLTGHAGGACQVFIG